MSPNKRTLWDISDDLLALEALLEEVGGDVTEAEAEAAIDQWLAEIGGDLKKKLDAYVALIQEAERRESVRLTEARRLGTLAKLDGAMADRLRGRLLWFLQQHRKTDEVQTDHYRIRVVHVGGVLPLQFTGEIPDSYKYEVTRQVTEMSIDFGRIRRELEEGIVLPFVHFAERGVRIAIK